MATSNASVFLIRSFLLEAMPEATDKLTGVASPKAQGQVMINTLVAIIRLVSKPSGSQYTKDSNASPKVERTKYGMKRSIVQTILLLRTPASLTRLII